MKKLLLVFAIVSCAFSTSKTDVAASGCNDNYDGTVQLWAQWSDYNGPASISTTWIVTYRTSATSYHTWTPTFVLPQESPADFYWATVDPLPHYGAHEVFVSAEYKP